MMQKTLLIKKILRFFILTASVLLHKEASSQSYIPMSRVNAHWIIAVSDGSVLPYVDIYEYYTDGDSTVNNLTYLKVYKRQIESANNDFNPPYVVTSASSLAALMRDDTGARKTYAIVYMNNHLCSQSVENLIYDFSVNIGDSLHICGLVNPDNDTIKSIYADTMFGTSTTIFQTGTDLQLYEGIGSTTGLLEPIGYSLSGYYSYLRDFCIGSDASCDILLSEPEVSETSNVYHDRNSSQVIIGGSEPAEDFRLVDQLGRVIMFKKTVNNSISIPATVTPGVYYLSYTVNGQKRLLKMII